MSPIQFTSCSTDVLPCGMSSPGRRSQHPFISLSIDFLAVWSDDRCQLFRSPRILCHCCPGRHDCQTRVRNRTCSIHDLAPSVFSSAHSYGIRCWMTLTSISIVTIFWICSTNSIIVPRHQRRTKSITNNWWVSFSAAIPKQKVNKWTKLSRISCQRSRTCLGLVWNSSLSYPPSSMLNRVSITGERCFVSERTPSWIYTCNDLCSFERIEPRSNDVNMSQWAVVNGECHA